MAITASCDSRSVAESEAAALEEILALELATYASRYGESDPTAYAQPFADRATCFDPWAAGRLEDNAINEHLMALAGTIPNLDHKILDPRVDLHGETAVFTFRTCTPETCGTCTRSWTSTPT